MLSQNILDEEVLKNFELLLKAKYEVSELAQVHLGLLAETFNYAKKLRFSSASKAGLYKSYLLFSEGGCY